MNPLSRHWKFYRDLEAAKRRKPGFIVPLESLRGVLIFFVFLHHIVMTYFLFQSGQWIPPERYLFRFFGSAPVTIFFFLTGYLFWKRLLEGVQIAGIKKFYLARTRRLFPAYALTVLLIFIVALSATQFIFTESPSQITREFLYWLSFGLYYFPDINAFPNSFLINAAVFWTLRIEAQFYLLFPLLAWFAKGKRIFLLLALTSVLYFFSLRLDPESWSGYTFTAFLKILLFGFGFGILTAYGEKIPKVLQLMRSDLCGVLAVIAFIALFFIQPKPYHFVEPFLLWFFFANVTAGGRFAKFLQGSVILFLGGISYSFYLTHGFILFLLSRAIDHHTDFTQLSSGSFFCFALVGFFLAVLFASVIFRWIEFPFLSDSRIAKN